MKCRMTICLLTLVFVLSCLMTACGDNKEQSVNNDAAPDSSAVQETVIVLETISDGSTVVQDSEGNKVTIDKSGNVTDVQDKSGNAVSVKEYMTTHSWIEDAGFVFFSGVDGSNGKSTDNSSAKKDTGKSNSAKPTSDGDAVEEEIPVIVATLPDEDDMIELPDI